MGHVLNLNSLPESGNGFGDNSKSSPVDLIAIALKESGVTGLTEESTADEMLLAMQSLREQLDGAGASSLAVAKSKALKKLRDTKVPRPGDIIDAVFPTREITPPKKNGEFLEETEPWSEEVDGAELLDDIKAAIERFCVLPDACAEAITLWVAFAWCHEAFSVSPILNLTSPTKRCGKSTALRAISRLVPRPLVAANISTASLFRAVEEFSPTLLVDEVDTFLNNNEEIRGIINAGHEREGAVVIRCEGDENKPRLFRVWCPKLISGIGTRPDTILDRSITIELRRKTNSEKTERLLAGTVEPFNTLRRKLARWSKDNIESLKMAEPENPKELNDRAADNWRSLLSIAEHAGGHWKLLSRRASLILSGNDSEEESVGILLLEDIREFFYEEGSDKIESAELAKFLETLEHRPWPEWRNVKPISPNGIARLLKHFNIRPKTIRLDCGRTAKGYLAELFKDAFDRYLPERGI